MSNSDCGNVASACTAQNSPIKARQVAPVPCDLLLDKAALMLAAQVPGAECLRALMDAA